MSMLEGIRYCSSFFPILRCSSTFVLLGAHNELMFHSLFPSGNLLPSKPLVTVCKLDVLNYGCKCET